jgi:arylsulfatase
VLLIMTDDPGYGVSGTFGGVIPTPAWIASRRGLRYTQFHSTALCSPTRRRSSPAATTTRRASA